MPVTKYIYNPATLRYERSRVSIVQIVFTGIGLLCFGFLFFIGLVYLQNLWIETPAEKALTAENNALKEYKIELALHLMSAQNQIGRLEQKDKSLYEKIFDTKKTDQANTALDKSVLLADGPAFHEFAETLIGKSDGLNTIASSRNGTFDETSFLNRKKSVSMSSVPSFPPVADMNESKLVSGFGIRINPFHKGQYHHDGIDLAAPRSSEVLAAAPGTVVDVTYSDLQAGFGNQVRIDHGDGYITRYSNLGDILIHFGQRITKGQPLARIGISGGSVAPHVHYEVIKDGKNLDPAKFLIHGLTARQYQLILLAGQKRNQSLD